MKAEEKFPAAFTDRMQRRLGNEAESFFGALCEEPVISIRSNPLKRALPAMRQPVPWCDTGYYLDQRPVFTFDPVFHAGCYYVQEASSMFLEQAILQLNLHEQTILALDLCAAPGGKTTHLASLLSADSLILSNETIQTRTASLKENVIKWGSGNVLVTQNDPAAFAAMDSMFDLVVTDAPCSGEGLFRKDPDSIGHWSQANGELCASRQQRILRDVLPALKPGGILIYSTCTYNEKENEAQVKWLSGSGLIPQRLDISKYEGVEELSEDNLYGYVFYPHKVRGEGFFLAAFRKEGDTTNDVSYRSRKGIFQPLPRVLRNVENWIKPDSGTQLFQRGEQVIALPVQWKEAIEYFHEVLHVKVAGTVIADIKGDKTIPHHGLAMSSGLNKNAFECVEVNKEVALSFLRKETMTIPAAEKGWKAVTHQGAVLGWLNHLGNRSNNYYPVEWRIRKAN